MPKTVPSAPESARILRVILFIVVGLAFIPFAKLKDIAGRFVPGDLPQRTAGRVSDFAGILSPGTRRELEGISAVLDRETGAELAVATVKSLGGEEVSKYAFRLFTAWGIGKKGKDNGALLLVAPKEHKVWIATGYGVEGSLPDGLCGEICRLNIVPHFKAGDYDSGTVAGARRIAAVLSGRDTGPPGTEASAPSPVSANILDEAGMLDAESRSTVTHYIRLLKEKAGVDLFIVTVPSTGGRTVEEVAKERGDRAGLASGKGVLVLVSREGSGVAVETSPGLMSADILNGLRKAVTAEITSALAKGNVLGGFWNAVARVWGVFGGRTGSNPLASSAGGLILLALFLSIFILIGGFLAGAGIGSRATFLSLFGAFFGGMPFLAFSVGLLAAAGTAWVTILHAILGTAAFYGGLKVGKASPRSFRGTTTGTGWIWGGGGGGGGFGGGGGGGGFGGGFSGGGGGGGSW